MKLSALLIFAASLLLAGCSQETETTANKAQAEPQEAAQALDMDYVEDVRGRAWEMWQRLEAVRQDEEFHRYGFSQGGRFHDWESQRQELQKEWVAYIQSLPLEQRLQTDLMSAIIWIYPVTLKWVRTKGRGSEETEAQAGHIRAVLDPDSPYKYGLLEHRYNEETDEYVDYLVWE